MSKAAVGHVYHDASTVIPHHLKILHRLHHTWQLFTSPMVLKRRSEHYVTLSNDTRKATASHARRGQSNCFRRSTQTSPHSPTRRLSHAGHKLGIYSMVDNMMRKLGQHIVMLMFYLYAGWRSQFMLLHYVLQHLNTCSSRGSCRSDIP